jgi:hypothetical protein
MRVQEDDVEVLNGTGLGLGREVLDKFVEVSPLICSRPGMARFQAKKMTFLSTGASLWRDDWIVAVSRFNLECFS